MYCHHPTRQAARTFKFVNAITGEQGDTIGMSTKNVGQVCMSVTSTSRSEQVVNAINLRTTRQDFEIDTVGVSTIKLRGTTGGRHRQTRVLLYKY